MKTFGLTGGIASGKSTVAKIFITAGIPVIDADDLARRVVKPGKEAYKAILKQFGKSYFLENKTIDRKKLGELIFKNENKRKDLESITHPQIAIELQKELSNLRKQKKEYAIYMAPLLFETGISEFFDETILVDLPEELQLKRLMNREEISEQEARARVKTQMPRVEKTNKTEYIILNSSILNLAKKTPGRLGIN